MTKVAADRLLRGVRVLHRRESQFPPFAGTMRVVQMEGILVEITSEYRYLKPKRGSRYQQLFFGRIRAEVLYRETVGAEPLTPSEVAREYNVPPDAVLEAIDYCIKNKDLLDAERAREEAGISNSDRGNRDGTQATAATI